MAQSQMLGFVSKYEPGNTRIRSRGTIHSPRFTVISVLVSVI